MGVTFKKGNAFPKGRRFIGLIWQDLAHAAFFLSNVAESVDDEPCFINKDDVAVFSCQFKNQFFCDDLAFPANQIDAYDKNAVKAQLRDGRNAAFFKVFTKEHAETGRPIWPFRKTLGKCHEGGIPG